MTTENIIWLFVWPIYMRPSDLTIEKQSLIVKSRGLWAFSEKIRKTFLTSFNYKKNR